jgi:hypothetical protein
MVVIHFPRLHLSRNFSFSNIPSSSLDMPVQDINAQHLVSILLRHMQRYVSNATSSIQNLRSASEVQRLRELIFHAA